MTTATATQDTQNQDKRISVVGWIILAVLVLLIAVGLVAGIYRLANGLGETTNLSDAFPWGLWIVLDFTLIAFSGAAFTLSLLVYIFNLKRFHGVLRQAVLTGFLGYIAVLVILLVDLGRWDRFWAFLVYPNVHSPLFEISWCVLLYSIVLTLEVLPTVFERFKKPGAARTLHRWSIVIVIAGITLSTLHQSTLGTLYAAMPYKLNHLWWTPMLPLLFFISAVGAGLSATILVALLAGWAFNRKVDMKVLGDLAKGSVWLWIVYLLFKLEHLWGTRQFDEAFAFDKYSIAYLAELGIGVVLPIILYSISAVRNSKAGLLITSLLVTSGILLNRLNATLVGQEVTQSTWLIQTPTLELPSYTPSAIEWLVLFGVLAAAAVAWYLAARFLPILPEDTQEAEAH